jgi:large subunit ribosomal protein L3
MPTKRSPRKGSLQFWPRKRASKFLPSVNWSAINPISPQNSPKNLKGFICYKVGMASASVKDNTQSSMTKGKTIIIPVTILECPSMKILSARFYKEGNASTEVLADNLDKELKSRIKLPKTKGNGKSLGSIKPEDFSDARIIAYSQSKKTGIKKTPDIVEIGLTGSMQEKMKFIKDNMGKEIPVTDVFTKGQLVDVRGLTRGRGLVGPVKRFGIQLKQHKSEKGRRRPGSLGPWHPARVTFRAPQAGQFGMFSRISYNGKLVELKSPNDLNVKGIKNFGDIGNNYALVQGSVQGPEKRQLLITYPLRETKKQSKKSYEFLEMIR